LIIPHFTFHKKKIIFFKIIIIIYSYIFINHLDNVQHWFFFFFYQINHVNFLLNILYSILYYVSNKNQLKSFVLNINDHWNVNFCIWKSTNNKFKSLTFNKNYNTQNNLCISIMMTQDQYICFREGVLLWWRYIIVIIRENGNVWRDRKNLSKLLFQYI
jgi:hypothetical protein